MLDNLITEDLKTLRQHFLAAGFDIRFVGGCVRDSLLGISPKDIDLCTDARPDEQIEIYRCNGYRWIETGLQHGTITVVINTVAYEITSLRVDVETDGRHATVDYTTDWLLDAGRRDFTCNGMSYTFDSELIDPFDGQTHLKNNMVVFIGNADDRIKEDYLRILRWFRFNIRFGNYNNLDKNTIEIIIKNKEGLKNISSERIWSEYSKIISSDSDGNWTSLMASMGINSQIGIPFSRSVNYAESDFLVTYQYTQDPVILMSALAEWNFWDMDTIWDKWNWSNSEVSKANWFCKNVNNDGDLMRMIAFDNVPRDWIRLLAQVEGRDEFECHAIANWHIEPFPVTGNDLIACGFKQGKDLGNKLRDLKEIWAKNGYTMSKSELLKYI